MDRYWAHRDRSVRPPRGQRLVEHLCQVAERARAFADVFGAGPWGYAAGLWHDLGKYSREFQRRIDAEDLHEADLQGKVDHSSAGAQHAVQYLDPVLGGVLAFAITGHHAGLLDAVGTGACLEHRLKKQVPAWAHGLAELPTVAAPLLPEFLRRALDRRREDPEGVAFSFAFFTRMVFSCLVDADFLDAGLTRCRR